MAAVGEGPAGELSQDVVKPVDRLHCSCGVFEGGVGERALREVNEQTDAVGDILIERWLQADDKSPRTRFSSTAAETPCLGSGRKLKR